MLKLARNKKAQNTAEYAILIALVIGAVIAMQTYAQRAMQGRIRDAAVQLRDVTSVIGNTLQYEPYYTNQQTDTVTEKVQDDTYKNYASTTDITKETSSVDRTEYSTAGVVDVTGVGAGAGM